MKLGYLKLVSRLLLPILLMLTVILVCANVYGQTKTALPAFQKGIAYMVWADDKTQDDTPNEYLASMAAIGVNYVSVIVVWYQNNYDFVSISANERTPSDSNVLRIIKAAHDLGMSVMLKPRVALLNAGDASGPGDIGFQTDEKWNRWSDSYVRFIAHYAKLAENSGVEIFCIGDGLTFASSRTDIWKNKIIPAVRNIFSGAITYAADWDSYRMVEFWDDLDYAGINAYFPLAQSNNPMFEEIVMGWDNRIYLIEVWQRSINKPVIFTECGYPSVDSAAKRPWEEPTSAQPNLMLQAECYHALFSSFWGKSWFSGVYWWCWNTYPGTDGESLKYFTPRNKPAQAVIKEWYARPSAMQLYAAKGVITNAEVESAQKLLADNITKKLRDAVGMPVGLAKNHTIAKNAPSKTIEN